MKLFSILAMIIFLCLGAAAQDIPVINFGHVGHDHHLALFLACDLGESLATETTGNTYLKKLKDKQVYDLIKEGKTIARIQLQKVGGGAKLPQALASNQLDIGFGGSAPAIFAIDSGAKLKIIAAANADGDMLVMRPDFPASNWKEFVALLKKSNKTYKIGCKDSKAVAVLILMAALKHEKITFTPPGTIQSQTPPAVALISLGKGSSMLPALKRGAVDGFVMNQPVPAKTENLKVGKIICDLKDLPPQGKWESHPCCCIIANTGMLNKHPQITRALLDVIVAAGKHAKDKNTPQITARWTGMPLAVEQSSIPTNVFLTRPDKKWNKGMDNWFELMKYIKQFHGKLKDVPTKQLHEMVADYSYLPEMKQSK